MRCVRVWTVCAAVFLLLPAVARAQVDPRFGGIPIFAQPFQYTDPDGPGTLTITPLSVDSTRLSFQQIRVTLEQGSRRFVGAGVYHAFPDDSADLPPFTLVAFTLTNSAGRSFFFQGRIVPVNGYTGEGTYFPVDAPQNTVSWRVQSAPVAGVVVNSAPALRDWWSRVAFSEAVGGVYFATYNRSQAVASSATWSGSLPSSSPYRLEVFIPRQQSLSSVPRTNRAVYQIVTDGPSSQVLRTVNQQVNASQWVELGTFHFANGYRVILTDATGEPSSTRAVVANAIRLTPVTTAS
jgi:hypothetical protein